MFAGGYLQGIMSAVIRISAEGCVFDGDRYQRQGVPCWSVTFPESVILFCAVRFSCDRQTSKKNTCTKTFILILDIAFMTCLRKYIQGEMISLCKRIKNDLTRCFVALFPESIKTMFVLGRSSDLFRL